jgi:hypothetical protein
MNYLKRLNWFGFFVILILSMVGVLSNENVTSFKEWLILVTIIGIPCSLIFLFLGMKDK